jgi:predicted amidohydrolase
MLAGVLQIRPEFGDPAGNVERCLEALRGSGVELVVLPELVTTGYRFADRAEALGLAEPVPDGPSTRAFRAYAEAEQAYVCFGLPEREGNRLFNTAVLVGPEGVVLLYRKAHLFWDEFDVFEAGDRGFPVADLKLRGADSAGGAARVGILICFDWVFPEAARALALQGAEVILHPSNLVLPFCQRAMVTRSLENGVFSITSNRTGVEERAGKERLAFTGGSQILSVKGEVLASLDDTEESLALAEIDPAAARRKSLTPRNDLFGDRRPDLYGPLTDPVRE